MLVIDCGSDASLGGALPDHCGGLGGPERPESRETAGGLQDVGFTLAVSPDKELARALKGQLGRGDIAEVLEGERTQEHVAAVANEGAVATSRDWCEASAPGGRAPPFTL